MNPSFNICRIANSSLGVKRTEEYRLKMSASKKGKKHRPECREAKSIRQRGKTPTLGYRHTDESKKLISEAGTKSILQKDKKGNIVKEWNSSKEAAEFYDCFPQQISAVLTGKRKTLFGFIWTNKY